MIILVTGARSGIGLRTAVRLGRAGHTVIAGLRDVDTAEERLVPWSRGLDVIPVQLDVTSPAERHQVVDRIRDEHGRLDALVNNAGVALGGFLEQLEEDELRRVFEVNLFGLWALTRVALPLLRGDGGGVLVNVSSMSGRMAFPGLGTYAASKFAVEGLTEAWRHELRPFDVDVYAVQPGAYRTAIWDRNRNIARRAQKKAPGDPYTPLVDKLNQAFQKAANSQMKDPEEVAETIQRLVEERPRRFRHPVGRDAVIRMLALRVLPFRFLEQAIARIMKLG